MRKYLLGIFTVVLIGGFSSCITYKKINYMQKPDMFIPAYKDTVSFVDYKLKPGDYLFIRVYSVEDNVSQILNGFSSNNNMMGNMTGDGPQTDLLTYKIKTNGCIDFPMVGEIELADKSLRDANSEIENKLSKLLKSCAVDTRIVRRYFSVISDDRSGRFSIVKDKTSIFEAMAMAGDLGIYSDRSKIRIIRERDDSTQIIMFDLRSEDIIHSEYYYVEPNDVIYVQNLNEQFFSITTFPTVISTFVTTYSFGYMIYKLIVGSK